LINLDIGWLNSRSGRVEKELEAELWTKANLFLEELLDENKEKSGTGSDDVMRP